MISFHRMLFCMRCVALVNEQSYETFGNVDGWRYMQQNNVSSSGEYPTLQECVDAAYEDMVRSKI